MSLIMKAACQRCRSEIPGDALAYICSYECTFCESCVLTLAFRCPNCRGELVPRPLRAADANMQPPKQLESGLNEQSMKGQLQDAQVKLLRAQLQPHFLFNTLHSISALMHSDLKLADNMIARLGDLLRKSFENYEIQETTLARELDFVRAYLDIEKIRFGDGLRVVINAAPESLTAKVPALLLQPLVENAVKHGISQLTGRGEVRVDITTDQRSLHIRISNDGPKLHGKAAPSASASGLGLRATRERLQTLYERDQALHIQARPEGGAEVSIRIPFRQF
jgi:two-component system, LytTR family, sensor kinase